MTTTDDEHPRPDDQPASSASISAATAKLYEAATGNPPPNHESARYDNFRKATAAIVNAAAVHALKMLDARRESRKVGRG